MPDYATLQRRLDRACAASTHIGALAAPAHQWTQDELLARFLGRLAAAERARVEAIVEATLATLEKPQ